MYIISGHNTEEGGAILAETWKAIADQQLSDDDDGSSTVTNTPRAKGDKSLNRRQDSTLLGSRKASSSLHATESNGHPNIAQSVGRRGILDRYNSLSSDEGRDSRISLPEISSSPLINVAQGGGVPDNATGARLRPNASSDSLSTDNTESWDTVGSESQPGATRMPMGASGVGFGRHSWETESSLDSQRSSSFMSKGGGPGLPATPLILEEMLNSSSAASTPTPQPPPLADRKSGERGARGRNKAPSTDSSLN